MNDSVGSAIAMAIELGIPMLALVGVLRVKKAARIASSVLGATTPFLLLYLTYSVSYLFDDRVGWAFHAMWLITLVPFLMVTILGVGMSFWSWPSSAFARYFVSLASVVVGLGVLIGIGSVL